MLGELSMLITIVMVNNKGGFPGENNNAIIAVAFSVFFVGIVTVLFQGDQLPKRLSSIVYQTSIFVVQDRRFRDRFATLHIKNRQSWADNIMFSRQSFGEDRK